MLRVRRRFALKNKIKYLNQSYCQRESTIGKNSNLLIFNFKINNENHGWIEVASKVKFGKTGCGSLVMEL